MKYNKHYIGLAEDGHPNNFVTFKPQKSALRFELRLSKTEETLRRLEEPGLEVLGYNRHFGYYNIRLSSEDLSKHEDLVTQLMREAYESRR